MKRDNFTMQKDKINAIEQLTAKQIDYIVKYKPRAKGAQSAQHFFDMTIIKPIALNVYPEIYVDLIKRFEHDEAVRHLNSMGLRVAKYYYSTFPEKLRQSQKFTEIFSGVVKTHLKSKLVFKDKIKEDKKLKSCTIEIHDCFFCSEIALFENPEIPYCTPIAGACEGLYNIKSLYNRNLEPRLIQVFAHKSAEYDGDICEYKLVVID